MNRSNLLPPYIGIALLKSEFCFCTGLSPYNLRKLLVEHKEQVEKMGYTKYSKLLMPNVVLYLLDVTGLSIDIELYYQYRHKQFV